MAIFAAARRGDDLAREVVAAEARRLALAIAVVAPILDPQLVILGGGIVRTTPICCSSRCAASCSR